VVTPWPVQNNHQKPLKKDYQAGRTPHSTKGSSQHSIRERQNIECFEKKAICLIFYTFTFKNKDKLATDYQKIQSFYSSWIECLRLKT